ncbi:tetratricopeptide repeat protein [Actinoplanes sp. LDG1-06]|uniref:Tetratricopeptide repeat protein n=1 Tax=Paractinoplanes ovalisporus TaxID=2810368 RepID=A0ABS2A4Q3_9ACTN|nr:BTAD domain-containing putative transcriptional regulator [Actinoplanes ovalisporus]MBM2614792.1 tetratricopeptide repeat protein [Actinoplanes ovalisporus]
MDFRLLGPLEVRHDQQPLALGQRRGQRLTLGLLLLEAGRVVPLDRLLDLLWEGHPPHTAAATLQSHVARLRTALDPERDGGRGIRLVRRGEGYAAEVEPGRVDAHRFRDLVARAREFADPEARAAALREALALWRGPLLADVASDRLRDRVGAGLEEERLSAWEDWAEAELAAGQHHRTVPELTGLVREHPLRERLTGALMLALHRDGRRSDALDTYHQTARRLRDEYGLDPGAVLRRRHAEILRDEPALNPPVDVTPALLPAASPVFAGRAGHLRELDRLLDPAGTVTITVIAGTAGAGKTALAVHWAHRVAGRFPDGQLYVNLRGFDPTGAAVTPAEAVRSFLDALGVSPQRVPPGLPEQINLYRSLMTSRRMLVLLDNARDAEQVRPLLPGSSGCRTVLTSRNRLAGLIAIEGAHPLGLDVLPVAEARELLARRLGAARLTPVEAVDRILARTARLPLALAIVAARAAMHPEHPLTALVDQLSGLAPLADDDPATDPRAVFSWSYERLGPPAARLFRLLGTHPGPDIGAPAAAALNGRSPAETAGHLAELVGAHLISEPRPGRFTFHDLLRAYASELAASTDAESDRESAARRMLDHYLHTAHEAALLLDPHRDPLPMPAPAPGSAITPLRTKPAATRWFAAERDVLLSVIRLGPDTYTWQLASALTNVLDRVGRWDELIETHEAALAAARRLGDRAGQAHAHRGLARAYTRTGRYDDAYRHLDDTLRLFAADGDHAGLARTHLNLGQIYERQGRHPEALDQAERALAEYRDLDHRAGQARALNNIGWSLIALGRHDEALVRCQAALALHQQIGNRVGEANTWDSVGYAYHHLGRQAEAIDCYRRALELFREVGDRFNETEALVHLGEAKLTEGDPAGAREAWSEALAILEDLHHPDAERLRERIFTTLGDGH